MDIYTTKLVGREDVAQRTTAFYFEKPAGFTFRPGQYLDLMLIHPPETDAEGNKRDFSIASAPHENRLMIATRMRDTAFKRVLKTMPVGTEVDIKGPSGSFFLHKDASRPAVILAGGIGITPFRSMILEATYQKLPNKIFLFYANRRPEDAAFLSELQKLTEENKNFRLIAAMTEMEKSKHPWQGERGYITKEMIKKYLPDITLPIYYIAGPPLMVMAMREMLNAAGIDDEDIRSEEFAGY